MYQALYLQDGNPAGRELLLYSHFLQRNLIDVENFLHNLESRVIRVMGYLRLENRSKDHYWI